MPELIIQDTRDGYVDLVKWVKRAGDHVAPRGLATREIRGALVTLTNPFDALPLGVGRGVNLGIACVESLQLLSGLSLPGLVVAIGPIFDNFREDNGLFHGAYGPRTLGQYNKVIERLKADPDTRQAVVTIWDKNFDLQPDKRDYPCTLTHVFHIRNNKLEMRTHMRSNDVIKGVGYDYWQFTRVQLAIANVLGIEPGNYYHYADSLHLYESDLDLVDKLHYYPTSRELESVPLILGSTWDAVANSAARTLDTTAAAIRDDDMLNLLNETERWHAEYMLASIRKNEHLAPGPMTEAPETSDE